ncbi:5183_t:CDS:2, partial [Racocetra fulgida]
TREWTSIWKQMNKLAIDESSPETLTPVEKKVKIKPERQYSYSQKNDVIGITFVEVVRATDLPAARNEWKEKLHFPVKRTELDFVVKFSVYDWDKFTTNDHVACKTIPMKQLYEQALKTNKNNIEVENIGDGMKEEEISLEVHDEWADKYKPKLVVSLKFIPYDHLRMQFWRAYAKHYDSDGNGVLNLVELDSMLNKNGELEFSEVISCLEDWLNDISRYSADITGEESDNEHLIFMKECPFCHRPDLTHLPETDIVTHVAICASNDWAEVTKIVTGDFVTESQAQRKWLSKVINKVGYGSFRIGANNAVILAQDRLTGEIVEEKMSTYVRLAKNLLKKLTDQQGKKFDKPTSAEDISPFIEFHGLNKEEILEPLESFKNFNEFFYRKLKPEARTCDSPEDPHVLVSPADCRMVCFPTINEATEIWIKGHSFTVSKLLNDDAMGKEFEGGSLGIFRLAPQDYHRYI